MILYSLLKQLKSETTNCMCNTSMDIIRIINPKRNHMYTGKFWLFEQATRRIYCTSSKTKQKTKKKMRSTPPNRVVNSCGSCSWAQKSPIRKHTGRCSLAPYKLDMLGATLFSRLTLTARAFCTVIILNSTLLHLLV